MHTLKNIFVVLVIAYSAFTLASCEKQVSIHVPPVPQKLVVNAYTELGLPLTVTVGKTVSLNSYDSLYASILTNATVKLYVNDTYRETLPFDVNNGIYMASVVTQPGQKYTLIVTAGSLPQASTTVQSLPTVNIEKVEHVPFARVNSNGETQDEVRLTFSDPVGVGDYYLIKITTAADSSNPNSSQTFCVNSLDGSIETPTGDIVDANTCINSDAIVMRDALFDGKQKILKLYMSPSFVSPVVNGADTSYPVITLFHIPEAYFKYLKSVRTANDSNGDPFSEPVNVYTNVTDGYGIFSILSSSRSMIQ